MEQPSNKLWEKYGASVGTAPASHLWTRYFYFFTNFEKKLGAAYTSNWQALSRAVIDICSRPFCVTDLGIKREKIGDLSTEMFPHIFYSFAMASGVTLHIDVLRGENDHHRLAIPLAMLFVHLRKVSFLERNLRSKPLP